MLGTSTVRRSTSTTIVVWGSASIASHNRLDDVIRHDDGYQTVLRAVVVEDVREARGDHGVEAVLLERPHGVLA